MEEVVWMGGLVCDIPIQRHYKLDNQCKLDGITCLSYYSDSMDMLLLKFSEDPLLKSSLKVP